VVEDLLHRLIAAEEPPDARCRAVRDALIPLDVVEEGGVELPLHLLRAKVGVGVRARVLGSGIELPLHRREAARERSLVLGRQCLAHY
jgi:hypothetical protein